MKIVFFGLLIVFSSSCTLFTGKDKVPPTTWCVLLDMSGVREEVQTRQIYADNFNKLFSKIAPNDVLVVGLITESSVNEAEFIVNHHFTEFKASSDNAMIESAEKSNFDATFKIEKAQIASKVSEFILQSNRIAKSTDIISAIHVADNILKKYNNPSKFLILLSDMEQYSADYRFPVENLNDDRNKQIIELEKQKPRGLPDLTEVKVYVAGAKSKDSDRFFRIKNFWLTYFDACHASLMKEDYGATMIEL
jgi:hypothetical protein